MANDIAITAGVGTNVATDDVSGRHYQLVKLVDGTEDGTERIAATAARGMSVDPRQKRVRITVSPTISTSPAYTAKDAVGGLMTFANAARTSGGSIVIEQVVIVDKDQEMASMDLVLFDQSIGAPTDNAIFDPTDAELANVLGVIPITPGDFSDFNDNSVASRDVAISAVLNGTSLFGVLVARGTPTYTATTDLSVILTIRQD
jgi:hypothetical protein